MPPGYAAPGAPVEVSPATVDEIDGLTDAPRRQVLTAMKRIYPLSQARSRHLDSLLAQAGQTYVATIQDGKVKLQRVRVGNDDGSTVEVLEGLHGGEYVALNLGTDVPDGAPVRAQEGEK